MRKYLFAIMVFCIGIISQAKAENTDISNMDNVIYIEPMTAQVGSEITLSIRMKNSVVAEGFGFDLYLPEGISFVLDGDGLPDSNLSTVRTNTRKTNNFDSAILANGSLRVFAYSTNGSTISGNDGEIWIVKIKISNDITAGDYPIILREEAISKTDGRSINIEDAIETTLSTTSTDIIIVPYGNKNSTSYNLQGQHQTVPQKGINIINGQKVIVK